ncbi:hypothetical protein PF011_g1191 [Phytophthora fragariae]|uniref:Uncharacterized protein n=1 Tax=Phytophthora fragariae TaxID=53985 RepID=A0A6A3MKK0_9STRA|nr:hypothetical protein PF011_g1191 [Phytophthora fragariae]
MVASFLRNTTHHWALTAGSVSALRRRRQCKWKKASCKASRMKLSLWTGKFRSTELFQFVAGWSVDLAQWVQEISDLTSQKDAYEGFRQEGGQVLREKGRIRPIARSSKLRSVRVGQIVHELRTDMLRDLLPLTLYGCTNTGHPRMQTTASTNWIGILASSRDGVLNTMQK